MRNEQSASAAEAAVSSGTIGTEKLADAVKIEASTNSNDLEKISQTGGIVVVHSGAVDQSIEDDTASLMKQMQNVPVCYPLLPNTIGLQEVQYPVEIETTTGYFARLQSHLRQCAEAVAFDQACLNSRIREVDSQTRLLNDAVKLRRKRVVRATAQIEGSRELASAFSRMQMALEAAVKLVDRLNQMLPLNDRLEPFDITPFATSSIND